MKKHRNKIKIGENFSSGAEKVESLTRGETPQNVTMTQAATSTGITTPASQNTAAYEDIGEEKQEKKKDFAEGITLTPQQREAQAARRRVQAAVAKKQQEERQEVYKQEQMRRTKTAFKRWKEGYRVSLEREKERLNRRQMQTDEGKEPPRRAPGFGGWLAAVVALGTTTLALITVVAVGMTVSL